MCTCFLVPDDVLTRLAQDPKLPPEVRKALLGTAQISQQIRALRSQRAKLPSVAMVHAAAPKVTVYDCKHTENPPGTLIRNPAKSRDGRARRTFKETKSVVKFYKQVFKRNSMDDHGITIMSSIHYGENFN